MSQGPGNDSVVGSIMGSRTPSPVYSVTPPPPASFQADVKTILQSYSSLVPEENRRTQFQPDEAEELFKTVNSNDGSYRMLSLDPGQGG